MKLAITIVLFITTLLLNGCSTLSVNTDYDLKVDFSNYQSFDWLPNPTEDIIDELNNTRFINAIENQLAAKGLALVKDNPDFLIATHYEKEDKTNVTVWDVPYFSGNYHHASINSHGHHGSFSSFSYSSRINIYEYEQGTLVLDFIDAKTHALFWRATAKEALKPTSTPQEKIKEINAAALEILKNFPPNKN
ncbi:hypothetical protein MNBD_GAMMA07-580 [hydrothermal vent metagenome]|uniref:DUF4136 domain-containing protein n=1 Tax=hydrothermal vent metagenome TaxID=652676 RepID=A0A3B0WM48_9ZZZZ